MNLLSAGKLSDRYLVGEKMDQEDLARNDLAQALTGLGRLNLVGLAAYQIWRVLCKIIARKNLKQISLLDLASGGGDILFALERFAKRAGVKFEGMGLDIKKDAIELSNNRSKKAGSSVTFKQCNVLTDSLPEGYDIVLNSLFLHHLTSNEAVMVLSKMNNAAKIALIVSDLTRSRSALIAAVISTRLLSRSPIVHIDGPLSVRAAFTKEEAWNLAQQAGLKNPQIRSIPGFRFLLSEEK